MISDFDEMYELKPSLTLKSGNTIRPNTSCLFALPYDLNSDTVAAIKVRINVNAFRSMPSLFFFSTGQNRYELANFWNAESSVDGFSDLCGCAV